MLSAEPLAACIQEKVRAAVFKTRTPVTDEVSAYVVFLVERSALSFQYECTVVEDLQAIQDEPLSRRRQILCRDLGDRCLIATGLFRPFLDRSQGRTEYYLAAGKDAYQSAADLGGPTSGLFQKLSLNFARLSSLLLAADLLPKE